MTTETHTETHTEKPQSAQPDQPSDIHELVNIPARVKAFGKEYEIKKFSFGKLCECFEYVTPIVLLIENILTWPRDEKGKPAPTRDQLLNLAVSVISMSGPSVMGIVSVATEEPVEWLREQDDAMGGLAIFAKAVEKNLDFFTLENIKRFKDLFAGLQARIPQDAGK